MSTTATRLPPDVLRALASTTVVMLTACGPTAPGDINRAVRDGGPTSGGGDAAIHDGGTLKADAGTLDGGTARDGGPVGNPLCPPMGATGTSVGNVMPNVALLDCDGNPVGLHDLCERRAAHLFIMAGW